MNRVNLVGRLGKDPELRTTKSGTSTTTISLATTERRKAGDKWEQYAEWHRLLLWGRSAENACKYLVKGSELAVTGRLQTRSYDKGGVKHYTTEVVVDDMDFIGAKASRASETAAVEGPTADDIPF
jgi:single-strand DNA-binding protein